MGVGITSIRVVNEGGKIIMDQHAKLFRLKGELARGRDGDLRSIDGRDPVVVLGISAGDETGRKGELLPRRHRGSWEEKNYGELSGSIVTRLGLRILCTGDCDCMITHPLCR